jgi:hypothetical protein
MSIVFAAHLRGAVTDEIARSLALPLDRLPKHGPADGESGIDAI